MILENNGVFSKAVFWTSELLWTTTELQNCCFIPLDGTQPTRTICCTSN